MEGKVAVEGGCRGTPSRHRVRGIRVRGKVRVIRVRVRVSFIRVRGKIRVGLTPVSAQRQCPYLVSPYAPVF